MADDDAITSGSIGVVGSPFYICELYAKNPCDMLWLLYSGLNYFFDWLMFVCDCMESGMITLSILYGPGHVENRVAIEYHKKNPHVILAKTLMSTKQVEIVRLFFLCAWK